MSVESALLTQVAAVVTGVAADQVAVADFGEFRPDPLFPRIRFWAIPNREPLRTFDGLVGAWRIYRFEIVARTVEGSLGSAQAISMATELRAGLEGFSSLPDKLFRVFFTGQEYDAPDKPDGADHARIMEFRMFVCE